MPVQLLALTDGSSILVDKPILLLGRHPECDIQLNSRKVSRRHCCIAQVFDYLLVRDLGSTNGIRINGHRVLEGRLKGGDELTIGNFSYRVCSDQADESQSAPPPSDVSQHSFSKSISDLLESTEEPVALDESPSKAAKAKLAKPAGRAPLKAESDSGLPPLSAPDSKASG